MYMLPLPAARLPRCSQPPGPRRRWLRPLLIVLVLLGLLAAAARAEALRPSADAEVVETLPSAGAHRLEERRLRQRLRAEPGNAALAVSLAQRYLAQARDLGEPRFAGRALAVLRPWPDAESAPAEVVLLRANLQQHLHDFDGATTLLEGLVRRDPAQAQAWLTLATVRRVQGRYPASDLACRGLQAAGAALYANACLAENAGLRGDIAAARGQLAALVATPGLAGELRSWLWTSLAELEARAGNPRAAEAAHRQALAATPDDYARLSYADLLLDLGRPADARALLSAQPRSDAVLLRLVIAGRASAAPEADDELAQWRARAAQAALRPAGLGGHAREQAMFALAVDGDPARALSLARSNLALQREPIDLLWFARAARAANDTSARAEARALRQEMGLHDARLDALL